MVPLFVAHAHAPYSCPLAAVAKRVCTIPHLTCYLAPQPVRRLDTQGSVVACAQICLLPSPHHPRIPLNMAKRKAADSEPASSEADHNRTATPTSAKHNSKKQKIDWATIDDTGFDGFVVKSIAVKALKSSGRPPTKKQKNGSVHSATNTYKNASFNARLSQKNPFEETELSEVHCKIEPAAEWESTQRYRRFTSECFFFLCSITRQCMVC